MTSGAAEAAEATGRGAQAGGKTRLRIWGAGGSAPTGRPTRARLGGDTVCFEFRRDGGVPLVSDLGSGARDLGHALVAEATAAGRRPEVEVLLTHLHMDHVGGLPFFAPFYDAKACVTVRSAAFATAAELERALGVIASPPIFPIRPLEEGAARFAVFETGETQELAGFRVLSFPLHHPGGCTGFRVESPEGSVCVVGDHEHGDPEIDAALVGQVSGADVMLYDGTYDDSEYDAYRGWGHSTWQKGVELAEAAGVGRLLIHHHQPEHDDGTLEALESRLRERAPGAALARQGQTVTLGG